MALNRDATDWAALAVKALGDASAEIAWALARGETGAVFYSRVDEAEKHQRRAQDYLARVVATKDK